MSTSTFKVTRADEALNALMQEWCDKVASNGGTFSIHDIFETTWFTVYTINWPEGTKVEV